MDKMQYGYLLIDPNVSRYDKTQVIITGIDSIKSDGILIDKTKPENKNDSIWQ